MTGHDDDNSVSGLIYSFSGIRSLSVSKLTERPMPALINGLCCCLHVYSIEKEIDVELRIHVKSLHDLI